jgi:2,3-bisphosphoglycerate-dependent phosphoglycerate mutase
MLLRVEHSTYTNDIISKGYSMNWPLHMIFVRHGQSEGNVTSTEELIRSGKPNHRFALTEQGRRQAQLTGVYLHTHIPHIDSFFCSTFQRTQETLSILYPDSKPIIDSRLNEMWHGIWNTLSEEQIKERYPEEERIKCQEGLYHYRPPGGQNGQDVELFIYSFIQTLKSDYDGKTVLIAAHGNWLLLFWKVMHNLTPDDFVERTRTNRYKNCALSVYRREGNAIHLIEDNRVYY